MKSYVTDEEDGKVTHIGRPFRDLGRTKLEWDKLYASWAINSSEELLKTLLEVTYDEVCSGTSERKEEGGIIPTCFLHVRWYSVGAPYDSFLLPFQLENGDSPL